MARAIPDDCVMVSELRSGFGRGRTDASGPACMRTHGAFRRRVECDRAHRVRKVRPSMPRSSRDTATLKSLSAADLRARFEQDGDAFARDLWLLRRWSGGDGEAGVELLGHYQVLFYRLCGRLGVRSDDDISDIYQDLLVEILKRLPALQDALGSSFAGWFSWRTRKAVTRWRGKTDVPSMLPDDVAAVATTSRIEVWEAIRSCWDRLPAKEYRVFELRFLHELSLSEVAEETQSNANAVAQSIFRLSRRMRTCLDASGFGPDAWKEKE